MSITNLLSHNNFLIVNKTLAKQIGLDEAILLGELASEYDYYLKENRLTEDGYFFSTIQNIENNTTFKESKQRKILTKLNELNLIKVKLKGLPAKRYIKLNEKEILNKIINL